MWGRKSRRERELAELAALADGSLSPERRAAVEARVAASPALQALLEEQHQTVAAIRGIDEPAPERLRMAIATARPRTRRLRPAFALGAAGAASLVVLALPGSESPPPPLGAVLTMGGRPATSSRPVPSGPVGKHEEPMLRGVSVEGVRFPDWKAEYGWRVRGSRVDRFGKRVARTVFYAKRGHRVAYTIVSGGPMSIPSSSRPVMWDGELRRVFSAGGRGAVTWERRGHMCVVSGHGLRRRTLVKLTA